MSFEEMRKRIGHELSATLLFMRLHVYVFGIDVQPLTQCCLTSEFDAFSVSIMSQIHGQMHTMIDLGVFLDTRRDSETLQLVSTQNRLADQLLSDFIDLQFEFCECTCYLDTRDFVANALYIVQPTSGGTQIDFLPPR